MEYLIGILSILAAVSLWIWLRARNKASSTERSFLEKSEMNVAGRSPVVDRGPYWKLKSEPARSLNQTPNPRKETP